MDMEELFSKIKPIFKGILRKDRFIVKMQYIFCQMVLFIEEVLKILKWMELENLSIRIKKLCIKEIGKMVNLMEKDCKLLEMEIFMKEILKTVSSMDVELFNGKMGFFTKDSLEWDICGVKES